MLFLALSSSILNIARHNNCVSIVQDFKLLENRIQNNPAYLPGLDRIESHNQVLADDCTLKSYCERSLEQLNIRGKKSVVAILN